MPPTPVRRPNCAIVAAAFAAVLLFALDAVAGRVYFYAADDFPADNVKLEESQRCYSMPCLTDEVTYLKWFGMSYDFWIAFFEDVGCRGASMKQLGTRGELVPQSYRLETVRSAMLWESTMYSARGIVDACERERANASSVGVFESSMRISNSSNNFNSTT